MNPNNRSPFLAVTPRNSFGDYLRRCAELPGVDVMAVQDVALTTIRYLNGDKRVRSDLRLNQELENRWYASLAAGSPDWNVYDADIYLGDLWACWAVYSRTYLLGIQAPRNLPPLGVVQDMGSVGNVVDLGCGIGYTTAALRQIFPWARVTATNFDGMRQTVIARSLGEKYGFTVVPTVQQVDGPADLVFASEYFEHIPAPIDHLAEVLDTLHPRALIVANAFGAHSIGHFDLYGVDGQQLGSKETAKRFNAELRGRGYEKVKTKLWNNRPTYWRRTAP